jgi:HSP20 family molecular chaperone IbpA
MSSLIPWRGEMDRLRIEMESLFDRFFDLRPLHRFGEEGKWMPAVDLSKTAKEIIVNAEIPGVETKNIDVINRPIIETTLGCIPCRFALEVGPHTLR